MPATSQPQVISRRDPALDGLRGVAILLVYLFHYGGGLRSHNPAARALGYLTQSGWVGVHLFFALSGFLITGLLADNLGTPHALRNFYARRALRILPVYYAALLAAALAAILTGHSVASLRPLLIYAAFLQNLPHLLRSALHSPPPLPLYHLWSLAVEEQFYLLWPFLLLAARTPRRTLQLCLWTFALSCVFRAIVFAPHLFPPSTAENYAVFLPTRLGGLALGGALAMLSRSTPPRSLVRSAILAWGAIGLGIFLLTGWLSGTLLLTRSLPYILGLPAVDLACTALVALSLREGLWRTLLSRPALRWLGRISYGFYILHILLEPLFDRLGTLLTHTTSGAGYQTARLLLAFPITAAAAWLSFTLLERPFLRLKRLYPRRAIEPV